MVLMDGNTAPPGASLEGVWTRPPLRGFSRINKIKEILIYFYSLSVNYKNPSPAIGKQPKRHSLPSADHHNIYNI